MTNNRSFWIALQVVLLGVYAAALWLAISGQSDHRLIRIVVIVFAIHVLEVPVAIRALKERRPRMPHLIVATLLFGALWWIPARRGILPA